MGMGSEPGMGNEGWETNEHRYTVDGHPARTPFETADFAATLCAEVHRVFLRESGVSAHDA